MMMEPKVDFVEISLLKDDGQVTYPLREKEFYEWLRNNTRERISSVPVLKYKIGNDEYSFKVEKSRIPKLNKWEVQSIYQKTNTPPIAFSFDWNRDLDLRLDFERKLKAELEKAVDDSICVCKQRSLSNEVMSGNATASNF